jgi:hypothetical protein
MVLGADTLDRRVPQREVVTRRLVDRKRLAMDISLYRDGELASQIRPLSSKALRVSGVYWRNRY